jgi:hypothetical protein
MRTFFILAPVLASLVVPAFLEAAQHESAFACDRAALSPEKRKRHFDELGPALRSLRKSTHELADGFEFEFPANAATYQLLAEWVGGERLCCPFFDIDLRVDREGGPLRLRLTGRDGVKQFIKGDFPAEWFKP